MARNIPKDSAARDGKWLPGLTATTLVVEAARRVLGARLAVIRHYLPLAATRADEDVEHVHQLRVATRRAGSALRLFRACLPRKRWRTARDAIRDIRRAAAAARDWDVFQDSLTRWAAARSAREKPGVHFLHGLAFDRRVAAQQQLVQVAAKGLNVNAILAALGEPKDHGTPRRLGKLAARLVNDMLGQLDGQVAHESEDYEYWHQVRIRGKRLRYAMEILAGCFPPQFRQNLYPALEQLQDILGEANDSRLAVIRLGELAGRLEAQRPADWKRYQPGIEALLRWHEDRLPAARAQFAVWRTEWLKLRAATPRWDAVHADPAEAP